MVEVRRLLAGVPAARDGEVVETLLTGENVRLERIVSRGQVSPEGFWYDQPHDEWMMVVAGAARLAVEGQTEELRLEPGDAVLLPAHCRHRVTWTDPGRSTVWLALFVTAAATAAGATE